MYCEMLRFGSSACAAGTRQANASAYGSRLRKELKFINHHLGLVFERDLHAAEEVQVQAYRFHAMGWNAGREDSFGHSRRSAFGGTHGFEGHASRFPTNGMNQGPRRR